MKTAPFSQVRQFALNAAWVSFWIPVLLAQFSCQIAERTFYGREAPRLTVERSTHFPAIDGQEVLVEAGTYHVVSSDNSELRLLRNDQQLVYALRANPITHLELLQDAVALSVSTGEEDQHILLLFANKTGLEAVGSYSGVRSRGSPFGPVTQLQISQALATNVQIAGAPAPPILEEPLPNQILSTPRVRFNWRAGGGLPSPMQYELCITETGQSCAAGITYRWLEDAQRVAIPGGASGLIIPSASTGTPITGTRYEVQLPPQYQAKRLEWFVRACAPGLARTGFGGPPKVVCTTSVARPITWAFSPPVLSPITRYQSPLRPVFDWSGGPAAESYLFCISRPGVSCPLQPTDAPHTVVVSTDRYTTQYSPASDWELARFAGRAVHWTAAACSNATGCVYQNSVQPLTLQPPPPLMTPNLEEPQSGSKVMGRRAAFKWSSVANIQRYKLCVAPPGIECGTSGSYEQFVFTSTTAPDIYIPDRLTPDNAQTTLNWTIAACLTAEHCVYQPAFRTITISTMPSIRMVVLGDSVVWGQGLVESKKFYNLIAERIRTLAGMPVSIEVLAHSGATLVLKDGRDFGPLHKEVPTSYPTIEQQLGPPADPNAHDPIPNPRTVDLVLMGGCINDINVRNILNPTSFTKPTLQQYITTYCHLRMKEMLRKAGQRFPHANIVVTGYYPILSSETDLTGFAAALIGFGVVESPAFLSALGLPAAVFSAPGALPALVAALVATGVVKDDILDRAKIFHDDSKNALRDAVTQIGAELRASHRFHFVDAGYGRANAMFADRSWLYGLSLPGLSAEDAGTGPEQARRVNCHTNPETNQFICHRASIGHPNENGARNYANEAIRVLSSTVLNPAQP